MGSLRWRLVAMFGITALVVAVVMYAAVQRFSAEQIMHLAMQSGVSAAEAQAMFDDIVGRVLLIGAGAGVLIGVISAWWLLRRILRPLDRLTAATHALAGGDLQARVPAAPDRELEQLGDAFNRMAAGLEREERLRRALVEDVAHELRTPLTSLRGYTEALADGVAEPSPEMLRTVHEEIVRLARLVEGLDRLARGEAGIAPPPTRQRVDLAALALRAVELQQPDLARRGLTVRLHAGAGASVVLGDPDGLGQVLGNLLHNAGRYADPGGEVAVSLSSAAGEVRCAVANLGPTIPADALPLIWERLYRVDRSRTRESGGAGIGLAIVRQIVEAHGGHVGAASADGRTEVWFSLPGAAA